jgi:hypothetical protein
MRLAVSLHRAVDASRIPRDDREEHEPNGLEAKCNMKRLASTWFFFIGLCAGLAPTGRAQGQGAEEYVLILLATL